jgi:hypothetical protein
MKELTKKLGAVLFALAVTCSILFVSSRPVSAAGTEYDTLFAEADTATAGVEYEYPFTVTYSGTVGFVVYVPTQTGFTLTVRNSAGVEVADPLVVTVDDGYWLYSDVAEAYANGGMLNMNEGDYSVTLEFEEDTQFLFSAHQEKAQPTISHNKVTLTAGFTQKLSVADGTVKSWKSNKTSVATVNNKGVVTAKKAGKATISATTTDGTVLTCTVTVKENKFSRTKITNASSPDDNCYCEAYAASYDSEGNLVIKANFVNNFYTAVRELKNVKVTVTNAKGKKVAVYKVKQQDFVVAAANAKGLTYSIPKADQKIQKADLRNCNIKITGSFIYSK